MNKLLSEADFLGGFYYRAESGDTIFRIAEKFGTAPSVIIYENKLSEEVGEGQLLFIVKPEGKTYTVMPGDTLFSVAGGSKDKLYEIMNKNKTDWVFVGQKIII